MAAYKVPVDAQSLSQLIDKLERDLPRSNTVRATSRYARAGKLTANIYTDGWPDRTTVVCHILSPAVSEKGALVGHSTCKEKVLQVIQESGVVRWSKEGQLLIAGLEESYGDYLWENLQPPPGKEDVKIETGVALIRFYLPRKLESPTRTCPDGFFMKSLKPEYAAFVTSYWPYWRKRAKDLQSAQQFFESMIRNFHSVAVFQSSDSRMPVAWMLQIPHGDMAHAYVLEEFRGNKLFSLCQQEMSRSIREDGDIPQATVHPDNHISISLFRKAGFVVAGKIPFRGACQLKFYKVQKTVML